MAVEEAERRKPRSPKEEDKNQYVTVEKWLLSLDLHEVISGLFLKPLKDAVAEGYEYDHRIEEPFIRALGKGTESTEDLKAAVAHLVRGATEQIVDEIAKSIESIKTQEVEGKTEREVAKVRV